MIPDPVMKSSFELVAEAHRRAVRLYQEAVVAQAEISAKIELTHIEIFRLRLSGSDTPHELSVKLTNLFLYDEEHRKKIDVLVLEMTTLRNRLMRLSVGRDLATAPTPEVK